MIAEWQGLTPLKNIPMEEQEKKKLVLQERLACAKLLLDEVARLADELDVEVDFLDLVYRPAYGWERNGELIDASEWNFSDCVIGMSETIDPNRITLPPLPRKDTSK